MFTTMNHNQLYSTLSTTKNHNQLYPTRSTIKNHSQHYPTMSTTKNQSRKKNQLLENLACACLHLSRHFILMNIIVGEVREKSQSDSFVLVHACKLSP